MSRRRQTTRLADTVSVARPRAGLDLTPTIYCEAVAAGSVEPEELAVSNTIPLTVSTPFRRTFLAATVWDVRSSAWTLTFACTNATGFWADEWVLDADAELSAITFDGELDDRERALASVATQPDHWTPEWDIFYAQEQWGYVYWQYKNVPGVGIIPFPPGDPGYDPTRARATIHNLSGSVHVDHNHFGPYPDGTRSGLNNSTGEFPDRRLALPATFPAGTTFSVLFEPDLVGPGSPLTYMEYNGTQTLLPLVPFTATITFTFTGSHDNITVSGP